MFILLFFLVPLAFFFLIAFIMDWRAKRAGTRIEFQKRDDGQKDPVTETQANNMKDSFFRNGGGF